MIKMESFLKEPNSVFVCYQCGYRDRCLVIQYGAGHENAPMGCNHGLLKEGTEDDEELAKWELISYPVKE